MPKRRPSLSVTDQAVLRYLEQSLKLDLKTVRNHIRRQVASGVEHGASVAFVDGVRFVLRDDTVVTALPKNSRPAGHGEPDGP